MFLSSIIHNVAEFDIICIFFVKWNKGTFPYAFITKTGSLMKVNKDIRCNAANCHISVNMDLLARGISSKSHSIHLFRIFLFPKEFQATDKLHSSS